MQKQEADHVSLLLLLDPFLPMLSSLLHAISSTTQPGKLILYDTLQSLEIEVNKLRNKYKVSIRFHSLPSFADSFE